MEKTIKIRELPDRETEELVDNEKFKKFGPVKCNDCGFKGPFTRRLFHIGNFDIESDEKIVRTRLLRLHNANYCHFRTDGTRSFAESAYCPKCKSNDVIFDLAPGVLVEWLNDAKKYLKNEDRKK